MDKGLYCLILENPACTVRIGALGEIAFRQGWHVYVGSALGSGGLLRLERHKELARSHDKKPKWHIDYLLVNPRFRLEGAIFAMTGERLECRLAGQIQGEGVLAFGCSDCDCASHLFSFPQNPAESIREAFLACGLEPQESCP